MTETESLPAPPKNTKRWRVARRLLIAAAVFLTLIVAFYTEESWRGRRDWEACKKIMESKGISMDWANYIPPPVPDDQNVFGIPEMQKWFTGRGATELSKRLAAGRDTNMTSERMVVALVTIGATDAPQPKGSTAVQWDGLKAARQVSRLISNAVGPVLMSPDEFLHSARRPSEIAPAIIFLQRDPALTAKELGQFLPKLMPPEWNGYPWYWNLQVESTSDSSYKVTVRAPIAAADFLARNAQFTPDFELIRTALQRPDVRERGDYQNFWEMPVPNFVTVRTTAQRLAALAQCQLLQDHPEEALKNVLLLHDLCRILVNRPSGKPVTLVGAMIDVAVTGLYAQVISDGLAGHRWKEPQLVTLQEQLGQIQLLPEVRSACIAEPVAVCTELENMPQGRLPGFYRRGSPTNTWEDMKWTLLGHLTPRGWVYENLVRIAFGATNIIDNLDPAGQVILPNTLNAGVQALGAIRSHPWPYAFLAKGTAPKYDRALLVTAKNQTMVRQGLIACGLERYHLAHNAYPETLAALVPQFLAAIPSDIIGGQPMHYHQIDDGSFLLYSVGWNETDDGGKRDSDEDWVWDNSAR